MRKLIVACLVLLACSSIVVADPAIDAGSASDGSPDATSNDATSDDMGVDATASDDAGDVSTPYNYCVSTVVRPTEYPRLTEVDCVDSNNVITFDHYFDSQLQITCNWGLAAADLERCLPNNETTNFLFADPGCSQPIALVKMNGDVPIMPYVGLDAYKQDAAITDSVFLIGDQWPGKEFFFLTTDPSSSECYGTYHTFYGFAFYYVGDPVLPSTFVER